jgi:hypothetical protein
LVSTESNKVPSGGDRRYLDRASAIAIAIDMKEALQRNDSEEIRAAIAVIAREKGFFSVWMATFDDSDMRRRFIAAFPGTDGQSFDANGSAVPRPGGVL